MSFYIEVDSEETFENVTKNSAVCVVDFYTTWCGPCKALAPKLEKSVKEHTTLSNLYTTDLNNLSGKVTFLKVNIETNQEIVENFSISSIPLIHFYKNGVLCKEKVVGADLNNILSNTVKLTSDLVVKKNDTNDTDDTSTSTTTTDSTVGTNKSN